MDDVPAEVITWCEQFAQEAGVPPPTASEIEDLLALAGVAAHASSRQSAPITCWLAATAGLGLGDALDIARRLSAPTTEERP
jgi:hypothetical protein